MHGSVRQIEKEWFFRCGFCLDVANRFFGVLAGHAALVFIFKKFSDPFITEQWRDLLSAFGGGALHVIGVGDPEVGVESLSRGEKFSLIPEMPFSDAGRGVARFLQVISNRILFRVQSFRLTGKEDSGDGDSRCIGSGEQLGPGGRANRSGIEAGQGHSLRRHLIEMRRRVYG